MGEMRGFLQGEEGDPAEEGSTDTPEQDEQVPPPETERAPSMADLRALLTGGELAPTYSTHEEFGPWVDWGSRRVPLVLLRMLQKGVIKGWS
jgi:hypothetical protein